MVRRGIRSALQRAVRPREEADRVLNRFWPAFRRALLSLQRNAILLAIATLRQRLNELERLVQSSSTPHIEDASGQLV